LDADVDELMNGVIKVAATGLGDEQLDTAFI
jgi:hypothetical protein